jgi:Protein of unknown function (DUF5818)
VRYRALRQHCADAIQQLYVLQEHPAQLQGGFMRKTIVFALVVLTSAVWLQAQAMGQADNMPKTTTVQGCLKTGAGRYSLTASDGTVYRLTGEANKLKDHVGHEIEVTGTPTVRTKSTTQEGAASTVSEQHVISVKSIKHIADTCSMSK